MVERSVSQGAKPCSLASIAYSTSRAVTGQGGESDANLGAGGGALGLSKSPVEASFIYLHEPKAYSYFPCLDPYSPFAHCHCHCHSKALAKRVIY